LTHEERVLAVEDDVGISKTRQCELLGISRSSIYCETKENERDKKIKDEIDKIYTACPFYGSRRIKRGLKDHGIDICRDKTRRLMHEMGIEAIYPKKGRNTSISNIEHKKYPYLLSDITASFPNHIWGTDITYVKLENGWAYLNAILDWFSRRVIAWRLSETLESSFCIETLSCALKTAKPDIHNSDQGSQYTSENYTGILLENEINISMDGKGRCFDNIFTERLWRTLKYENIYLSSYGNIEEARKGIGEYLEFYNTKRKHQALGYRTPEEVYFESQGSISD